jgi:hypothetical protein
MFLHGDEQSEAGELPPVDIVDQMLKYNADLASAGVLQVAEGLYPSSNGFKVRYEGGTKTVLDGPFAEAKEVIVGFWMLQVASMDEAKAWAMRCPGGVLEVRQIFETADFGDHLTDDQRELEAQIRSDLSDG